MVIEALHTPVTNVAVARARGADQLTGGTKLIWVVLFQQAQHPALVSGTVSRLNTGSEAQEKAYYRHLS